MHTAGKTVYLGRTELGTLRTCAQVPRARARVARAKQSTSLHHHYRTAVKLRGFVFADFRNYLLVGTRVSWNHCIDCILYGTTYSEYAKFWSASPLFLEDEDIFQKSASMALHGTTFIVIPHGTKGNYNKSGTMALHGTTFIVIPLGTMEADF